MTDPLPPAGAAGEFFSSSSAYERFMGRWSRRLAPTFADFADVRDDEQILDVGAGTGSLARALIDRTSTTQVTGIDPAASYVEFATARVGGPRSHFEVGDAQHLPFATARFDRALSMITMNFIPDPRAALHEMVRVTRPGGTVAACVWDYGEGMEMLRIFWDEAVAGDPAAGPLDEQHLPLCAPGELRALWASSTLRQVVDEALVVPLPFASFDDYWAPFLLGQGPAGRYVAALDAPRRAALAARLRVRLLPDGTDRPISLHGRLWAVRGTVPVD